MQNIVTAAKNFFGNFGKPADWFIGAGMAVGVGLTVLTGGGFLTGVALAMGCGVGAGVITKLFPGVFEPDPPPPVPLADSPEVRRAAEQARGPEQIQAQKVAAARPITSVKTMELVGASSSDRSQMGVLSAPVTPSITVDPARQAELATAGAKQFRQ